MAINDKFRKSKHIISGEDVINYCESIIIEAHRQVGGRAILVECEKNEKLINFYKRQGYRNLRNIEDYDEDELVQLFKKL